VATAAPAREEVLVVLDRLALEHWLMELLAQQIAVAVAVAAVVPITALTTTTLVLAALEAPVRSWMLHMVEVAEVVALATMAVAGPVPLVLGAMAGFTVEEVAATVLFPARVWCHKVVAALMVCCSSLIRQPAVFSPMTCNC
jgi:hypothetical protein